MNVGDHFSDRIVRCWLELEIDSQAVTQMLVIETDLELHAGQSGYDAAMIDEIKMAAQTQSRAMAAPIDRIRIVPVRY
jgi:hypothetical protein